MTDEFFLFIKIEFNFAVDGEDLFRMVLLLNSVENFWAEGVFHLGFFRL
jgi:hypothetical protein